MIIDPHEKYSADDLKRDIEAIKKDRPDRLFWWVTFIFGIFGLLICYIIIFHFSQDNSSLIYICDIPLTIFAIWFLYRWIKNYNTPEKLKK